MKGEGREEGLTHFLPPGVTMGREGDAQEESQLTASTEKASPSFEWKCATNCRHTNSAENKRRGGAAGDEKQCMAWRGCRRLSSRLYFRTVRDVLARVLERSNEVETTAADAYTELVPNVADIFTEKDKSEQKDKKSSTSSSREIRQKVDLWKDERTHYDKTASRVGPEFHVDTLPKAGSYTTATTHTDAEDGGSL